MPPIRRLLVGCLCALPAVSNICQADTLAGGGYHALRVNNATVIGLGDSTYGQLGTNPTGSPATISGLSDITNVAAGGYSTLALKSDGTVWYFGESTLQHTTPHGTPNPVSTPQQVSGLAGIDAIAAGHRHYLALDVDTGNLYAWGHNGSGQVGNGGQLDVVTPTLVLQGVASISAGDGFSMAVKSDGSLWVWGRNHLGQLGLGDTLDRKSPTQVLGISTSNAVAAGGQHALLLLTDQTVLATGNNAFGQLGDGTTTTSNSWVMVSNLVNIEQVSAGYHHSVALDASKQVFVWGRNFEGQCGGGAPSATVLTSAQVLDGLGGTPAFVSCGYHFTLIEFDNGTIVGTGSNSDGQLDGISVADQDNSQTVLAPIVVPLTPDESALEILSLTPASGSTDVSIGTELVITFNEAVTKGSGQIRLKEGLANAIIETLDVSSANVAVNSNAVTLSLSTVLALSTQYYVEMDAGTLEDPTGNLFDGLMGVAGWNFTTATPGNTTTALLAHYAFDTIDAGTTPDSVGTENFATLGNSTSINTTNSRVGTGSLFLNGNDTSSGSPANGAITSNVFTWANDARTVTFWWKSAGETENGTFFSSGTDATGQRFDVRDTEGSNDLRVEIQGVGQDTVSASFDDGNWHFVAVTVPDNAEFRDIAWFVDGSSTNLNGSSSTNDVATGTGPLVFGDSIVAAGGANRVPHGCIDDFQLYNEVLTQDQILYLYNNPGSVIGTSVDDFESYIDNSGYGLDVSERRFGLDPDGDGLKNGLEAWLGTHPGEFNAGLAIFSTNGTISTFTHPVNPTRPQDLVAAYEWSPNLVDWYAGDGVDGPNGGPTVTISLEIVEHTATVTTTMSEPVDRLFLRVGVAQLP